MAVDVRKLRVNRAGEIVLRYALWKKRDEVIVSVYGLTGLTNMRNVLLQRVNMPALHCDKYYEDAGRNLAYLWATTNCVGDFYIYRGVNTPRTFQQRELENQS